MDKGSVFERIEHSCAALDIDFSSVEMATYANENTFSQEQLAAVADLFGYLEEKKRQAAIDFLLKTSRLPLKVPKTFDCFDFGRIHGKDSESVRNLSALTEIYARKNIALIGPPGVGKTHLAQAYGRSCCCRSFKTYFLKASELKAKFVNARKYGREDSVISGLVKPSCLIIVLIVKEN